MSKPKPDYSRMYLEIVLAQTQAMHILEEGLKRAISMYEEGKEEVRRESKGKKEENKIIPLSSTDDIPL